MCTRLIGQQELSASGCGELVRQREKAIGKSWWNANMLLCLVETKDKAAGYAGRGLDEDPRPEFRAAYLEFLLDNADEHRYDAAEIESLMDRENDSICISLSLELYRVARMQEKYLGPVGEEMEAEESAACPEYFKPNWQLKLPHLPWMT